MNKVLNFIKKIYSIVKSWIVANGIEGIGGFIIGLILLTFGYKFYSGIITGWTGNDLVINEAIYNSFVMVVLGCFGIAGLEKFANRK